MTANTSGASETAGTTTTAGATSTSGVSSTTSATETTSGGESTTGSTSATTQASAGETSGSTRGCEGGEPCPGEACDVLLQDCPLDQKCSPAGSDTGWDWDNAECVPITGDQPPGEACDVDQHPYSGLDDCALGGICWGADPETLEGTCVAICSRELSCVPGFTCLAELDEMPPLCLQSCDPLLQDCAQGESCVHLEAVDFVCVPSGGKGQGDGCGPLDCAPGLHCAAAELLPACDHERCCTPYCDLSDPESCADVESTECTPFADGNEPPQFHDEGYCGAPE